MEELAFAMSCPLEPRALERLDTAWYTECLGPSCPGDTVCNRDLPKQSQRRHLSIKSLENICMMASTASCI